jgi:hypothetical protein
VNLFRLASPGPAAAHQAGQDPTQSDLIRPSSLRGGNLSLENYLMLPVKDRIGVCCSGGGIRSASYGLGALQVLRNAGVLSRAGFLSAVSGGCYTAVAHATNVGATGGDFKPKRDMTLEEAGGLLPDRTDPRTLPELDDYKRIDSLNNAFGLLSPWALNSPEEKNLRARPGYLASGAVGWIWLVANMLYGMIRHLLPFAAGIVVAGGITGFVLHRWVDIRGEDVRTLPALWVTLALLAVAVMALGYRQRVQSRDLPSGTLLQTLQTWTLLFIGFGLATLLFLVLVPEVLVDLRGFASGGAKLRLLEKSIGEVFRLTGIGTAGLGGVLAIMSFLARKGRGGRIPGILVLIAAPLLLFGAYIGIAYWATLQWRHLLGTRTLDLWPLILTVGSALIIVRFWFLDQVTANMHNFYRERLATIFIGKRRITPKGGLEHTEPPWETSLYFSDLRDQRHLSEASGVTGTHGPISAELPKLVICAAVSLPDAVPPGRNAASFTFEQDWSGGPATNYIPTVNLEQRAGPGTLTLPAMMAISGAALAPSMGRQTRSGMRLLLAMFNIRLGVWLPNPKREGGVRAAEIREGVRPAPPDKDKPDGRRQRPGALYVLREALGLNSAGLPYVYVSDGGHWDNLGLVELLRRGCTQILCFDASGGPLGQFHTLSNAISLAQSDLGVTITIDTDPLVPDGHFSSTDVISGAILYPDGTEGVLVYARAILSVDSPPELVAFRQVDPRFPNHSTSDQFFDERKYESYRALGRTAALRAVAQLNVYRAVNGNDIFPSGDLGPEMPTT